MNRILDNEDEFEKYLDVTSQSLLDFTSAYMKKNVYEIIDRCERRGKLDATNLKSEVRALYDSLSSNQRDIPNKFIK